MECADFIDAATDAFSEIQEKYKLNVIADGSVLRYSNTNVDFSIYFERCFEIYICFHYKGRDLRLYDVAKWLKPEPDVIDAIKRNQISSAEAVVPLLKRLCVALEVVLDMLLQNPELCDEYLQYEKRERDLRLVLLNLQRAWEERDYFGYSALVEANRTRIEKTTSASLIFNREEYARKHLKQDKGRT